MVCHTGTSLVSSAIYFCITVRCRANMDHNVCKCAIMGRIIFNSERIRNCLSFCLDPLVELIWERRPSGQGRDTKRREIKGGRKGQDGRSKRKEGKQRDKVQYQHFLSLTCSHQWDNISTMWHADVWCTVTSVMCQLSTDLRGCRLSSSDIKNQTKSR